MQIKNAAVVELMKYHLVYEKKNVCQGFVLKDILNIKQALSLQR